MTQYKLTGIPDPTIYLSMQQRSNNKTIVAKGKCTQKERKFPMEKRLSFFCFCFESTTADPT
jgi:hypothetical protein